MRRIAAIVALSVTAVFVLSGLAGSHQYRVLVAGQVATGHAAHMNSGQLIGVTAPVASAIGAGYRYNPASRTVTLQYGGTTLSYTLGSQIGRKNGRPVWIPVAPSLVSGQPATPLWWLGTQLGASVRYTESTATLSIMPPFRRGNTAPPPAGHPLYNPSYVFPYPAGTKYQFDFDSWSDPRGWNGRAFPHEGNDIMATKGTPIVAVASGTISRFGWNTLGGYRVTIRLDDHPEYYFYYAHFDRYAPNLWEGKWVRAGQVLGYTGATGEGPERTEGRFPPHLHFGIYGPGFRAINPYYFLRFWEANRTSPLSVLSDRPW